MSEAAGQLNVLALAGSPRRGGNSETLLDRAIAGAESAGAAVEKIALNELEIRPCQNCGYCSKHGRCVMRDDMDIVCAALDRADRIILASPIFFTNVTAQTKMMVDRCQPYWARKCVLRQAPEKPDRAGMFLAVGGLKNGEKFFECARFLARVWMLNLNVKPVDALFCPGLDAAGAIRSRPDFLEQAFLAGQRLAKPAT